LTAAGELSFGKESRYFDHRQQGIEGLVTVIGIRYTTARGDSARALDLLLAQLPSPPARAATESTPLVGGDIPDFAALERAARAHVGDAASARMLAQWLRNYGTEYRELAQLARLDGQAAPLAGSDTARAQVTYAVREEMAVHLEDVILRRTELGSGSHPGGAAIAQSAALMQPLLGWSQARRRAEEADTAAVLAAHLASEPAAPPAACAL